MPEYVYTLYDFISESDDDISFLAGEHIEVIEKDEQYGDGWWQVTYTNALLCNNRNSNVCAHRAVI